MAEAVYNGIKFTDADIVNAGEYDQDGDKNRYGIKAYLLHDHGFCLAVVIARSEQDAIDEAVDEGKLDRFLINEEDASEVECYVSDTKEGEGWELHKPDGSKRWVDWSDAVTFLGNASEPFDIESLGIEEMPLPPFSFVALFNAAQAK